MSNPLLKELQDVRREREAAAWSTYKELLHSDEASSREAAERLMDAMTLLRIDVEQFERHRAIFARIRVLEEQTGKLDEARAATAAARASRVAAIQRHKDEQKRIDEGLDAAKRAEGQAVSQLDALERAENELQDLLRDYRYLLDGPTPLTAAGRDELQAELVRGRVEAKELSELCTQKNQACHDGLEQEDDAARAMIRDSKAARRQIESLESQLAQAPT